MTITYANAWRQNDPKLEQDAIALWTELSALPKGQSPDERAKELSVVAYEDGKVIALTTMIVQRLQQVRQDFAFVRVLVAPSHRLQSLSTDLMRESRKVIEAYALAHQEEKLAGMGAVFQAPGLGKNPIGIGGGTVLVGYTDEGYQVRIAWFDHFKVPPVMAQQ
tara:strand:- start:307 stop:798 length:492 start_codon:yes stop_codon:yes gene_type:complete